jgi:hypothetical protein
MVEFEDVTKCKDLGEFNYFVKEYLNENELKGGKRHSTFWALFYAWREEQDRRAGRL